MPFPNFIAPQLPINVKVQRCSTSRQKAPQRILIVKFGALGDIVMATPLLAALRRSYPMAYITWLVDEKNVEAVDANPFVDEIMLWGSGEWGLMRSTRPRNWIKNRFGLRWVEGLIHLKYSLHHRFDTFISFHPENWQFLKNAADPNVSVGVFQSLSETKRDYTSSYTKSYTEKDFPIHQVDIYLLPLDALCLPPEIDKRMSVGYTAEDDKAVDHLLQQQGIKPGFVILAPKTTWSSKCWPEKDWSALGDALAQEHRQVVLIGTQSESEAIKRVASGMQSMPANLAGALSFRQMIALIARASLCISGDTGPMHVASALNTPYVALFGPTPPARWAPIEGDGIIMLHPVPCSPCMKVVCPNPPETHMRCMGLLTVAEVFDAVMEAIRC